MLGNPFVDGTCFGRFHKYIFPSRFVNTAKSPDFFRSLDWGKTIGPAIQTVLFLKNGLCTLTGEILDGRGIFTWVDGKKYDGEWKDGKRNGHGNMTYGHGNMTYANGDVYDGEWKSSKRHGKGKMKYKESGGMYEEWREDKREGQDKMTCKDNKFNKCAYYVNKCVDQKILISSPKQAIFDLQSTFLRCLMKN